MKYLIYIIIILFLLYYIAIEELARYMKKNYHKYDKKYNNDNIQLLKNIKLFDLARYYHQKEDYNIALKYYNLCLLNNNYYVMIDIADIYLYGPKPNYNKAFLYYTNFLKINNIENKYKIYVNERLQQLYEILNNDTNEEINKLEKDDINYNIDKYLLDIININDIENKTDENIVNNNVINDNIVNNINLNDNINLININDNLINDNEMLEQIGINNGFDYTNIYNDIINDPQSIHNSMTNKTIKHSINNLEINTNKIYCYEELKDLFINDIINLNISNKKINRILKIFERIETDITQSYNNKKTLKDIFILIGNNIYTNIDNTYKNNAINNLIIEFDDCFDINENLLCFTGIYNRMINSLHLLDPSVIVKDTNIINQEILNLCSKIRNDYECNNNNEITLKQTIITELNKEYVKTKLLTQIELDNIIKEWIDYI